jgi:hypothetical protein
VLLDVAFNLLAALAILGRGIEGNVEPADAAQREAIERNIQPVAHA